MSPGKITYERSAITLQGSEKYGSETNLTEKNILQRIRKGGTLSLFCPGNHSIRGEDSILCITRSPENNTYTNPT